MLVTNPKMTIDEAFLRGLQCVAVVALAGGIIQNVNVNASYLGEGTLARLVSSIFRRLHRRPTTFRDSQNRSFANKGARPYDQQSLVLALSR